MTTTNSLEDIKNLVTKLRPYFTDEVFAYQAYQSNDPDWIDKVVTNKKGNCFFHTLHLYNQFQAIRDKYEEVKILKGQISGRNEAHSVLELIQHDKTRFLVDGSLGIWLTIPTVDPKDSVFGDGEKVYFLRGPQHTLTTYSACSEDELRTECSKLPESPELVVWQKPSSGQKNMHKATFSTRTKTVTISDYEVLSVHTVSDQISAAYNLWSNFITGKKTLQEVVPSFGTVHHSLNALDAHSCFSINNKNTSLQKYLLETENQKIPIPSWLCDEEYKHILDFYFKGEFVINS